MTKKIPGNKLLKCSRHLFQLVSQIKTDPENLSEDFYSQALKKMTEFEKACSQEGVDTRMVHEAKYALTAFIDELAVTSTWRGRDRWMAKPLQLEIFGEHLAGEGFYNHLSELRQSGAQFIDVLELYYVCLQLGFMGKYRLQQQETFLGLQADLRSQIDAIRGVSDQALSGDAIPKEDLLAKVARDVPFWVLASVTAALVLIMYFGFSFVIDHRASNSVTDINANKNALTASLEG